MYELTFIAEGEVRDSEGNLKSTEMIEQTVLVTKEQMQAILAAQQKETKE